MASSTSGFTCNFVQNPPEYLQTKCPICNLILRDSCIVTCCVKSYCKSCIDSKKVKGQFECPDCNKHDVNVQPNLGLQNVINNLDVHCVNKSSGCNWKGKLKDFDDHLNLNQLPERSDECEQAEIKCPYCSNKLKRKDLDDHQKKCDQRPSTCTYCEQYKSTFNDVQNNHLKVCDHFPVECTNSCGQSPKRKDLDSHIANECEKAVIECDFQYAGCDIKLPREDMKKHLDDSFVRHIGLLAKKQVTELTELKLKVDTLEKSLQSKKVLSESEAALQLDEFQSLKKEIACLRAQKEDCKLIKVLPVHITMPNFEHYKADADNFWWSSPPFYTHKQGYKLCMTVYATEVLSKANKDINCQRPSTETHISLMINMMEGEFDHSLQWPCCGEITIELLSKHNGSENAKCTFEVYIADRVTVNNPAYMGGEIQFVSYSNSQKYVCNDCLHFRVVNCSVTKCT